jgi:hypothetical protein
MVSYLSQHVRHAALCWELFFQSTFTRVIVFLDLHRKWHNLYKVHNHLGLLHAPIQPLTALVSLSQCMV